MQKPLITAPRPEDAEAWFDFLIEQQSITYEGVVRPDFAEVQGRHRDEWVPGLAAQFADPGTARFAVAKVEGRIVGLASALDGPQAWEIELGYTPSPAGRELARLYVHPDHHGTGLAHDLFDAVDDGSDLYLWMISGNDRARRFYERGGFVALDESFNSGPSWRGVPMHRMVRRTPFTVRSGFDYGPSSYGEPTT